MSHIFRIEGTNFLMRVVEAGDRYGLTMGLTHKSSDPLIEFYDVRAGHIKDPNGAELGQFVGRYQLKDIAETNLRGESPLLAGLVFNWDVDGWSLSAENVVICYEFLLEKGFIQQPFDQDLAQAS